MHNHSVPWRSASFRPENLGRNAIHLIDNFCFALFIFADLAFTIIASTYQPDDPLLHPSSIKITSYLTSTSNTTFRFDDSAAHTGNDFLSANSTSDAASFINLSEINITADATSEINISCDDGPVECADAEIFQTMLRAAIEMFHNIHF